MTVTTTKTLRQSTIKSWYHCRAAYYAQYVLGVNLLMGDLNVEYGTHVHKQVENYHTGLDYDKELLAGYVQVIPPAAEVEQRFKFTPEYNGEPLPWALSGTIDRIVPEELSDLKTSGTSYSQTKVDAALGAFSNYGYDGTGLQATMYLYYWFDKTKSLLPFTFVVYRKDKPNWDPVRRIQRVTTTRTPEQFESFWLFCYKTIREIEAEQDFKCSCKSKDHVVWEP